MNNSPRMKLLTLCIGAALAQMAGLPALADTAVGVDTVNGNADNPGYLSGPVHLEEDLALVKRSPSGQMYSIPKVEVEEKGKLSGSVDIGYRHESDQKSYSKRKEYSDPKNGLYLNNFSVSGSSEGARYTTINGGGVGRRDQFYDVTTGQYGGWKVKAFYNETLHVFTDTWKSLYSGEGTGNLSHGLAMPTIYTGPLAPTVGTGVCNGMTVPAAATATTPSTAATPQPCWSYNGQIYSNASALLAINGITGTAPGGNTLAGGTVVAGTPQSGLAAAIAAKLAATPYSELSLVRKKGGVRGDITLTDTVKAYASYTLEKRIGARPLGMNDGNAASTDFAEPIDYKTHDFLTGLSYSDDLTQANLRASASVFRNDISALNLQYVALGANTPNGVMQHATFALAPNNEAYNIKGEFARSLPDLWKGRFTAAASWGTNRENDALLAPLSDAQNADLSAGGVSTLTGANPGYASNTASVSNWNTVDALSRKTAKQRIDNKLVDLGLSLKPLEDLSVKASYRFYETDNKGGYIAYNPLTGQFGRGPTNGTAGFDAVVAPNGAGGCYTLPGYPAPIAPCSTLATVAPLVSGVNVPVFSQARSTRQYNYGVSMDYDLTRTSSLNGAVEREEFNRDFRERAKTWENKVKLGYVNRDLWNTTLRVSYENDTKRGSAYRYRTFEDLAQGLPGLDIASLVAANGGLINGVRYPALNANYYNRYSTLFRKYDQADRNQNILNTRVNVMALEDLDVGVMFQVKRANYPDSFYGLKKDDQNSLGLDFNYQASVASIITVFYNVQNGVRSMNMNSGQALSPVSTPCTAAGQVFSPVTCADTSGGTTGARPFSQTWVSNTRDRNDVLGLGVQQDLGFVHVGVDYTYTRGFTHITYDIPNNAAFGGTAANQTAMAAIAGSALPDMSTVQNTITLNLFRKIDKNTSVRASYRHDNMRVRDWHYDGVIKNVLAAYDGGTLLLDSGPMNYHVNTFGVFLNYKM